jgi:hypothetical protein
MKERSWLEKRMTPAFLLVALLAGFALSAGFARFDALHGEFLAANFDSVHGARTLLMARHFVALAVGQLENADAERPQTLLGDAAAALALAEQYAAEGTDTNPAPRQHLTQRLQQLREALAAPPAPAALSALVAEARQLAADFEVAELDRWGMLSSVNGELVPWQTNVKFGMLK